MDKQETENVTRTISSPPPQPDTSQRPYFVLALKDKIVNELPFKLKTIVLSEPLADIDWHADEKLIVQNNRLNILVIYHAIFGY